MSYSIIKRRAVIAVKGSDRLAFLNGLVSNDLKKLTDQDALYATLLTPQGRFLFDFFIVEKEDSYLLDVEAARAEDLLRRLRIFKLRSQVELAMTDWQPAIGKDEGGISFQDPRLKALGYRSFVKSGEETDEAIASYDQLRMEMGVPEGGLELIPEKSILLENGLDELRAIDWNKGCYMGQELTARTRYRGLVRKRLLPMRIEGEAPAPGSPFLLKTKEAGIIQTVSPKKTIALGMIRLEHLAEAITEGFRLGSTLLKPYVPDWMRLPEAKEDGQ